MKKPLNETDKYTIIHHYENTRDRMVKAYKLIQLIAMEGKGPQTIQRSKRFLPVRIDMSIKLAKFKAGQSPVPYQVRYIRLDEIESVLSLKTGKKVHISYE